VLQLVEVAPTPGQVKDPLDGRPRELGVATRAREEPYEGGVVVDEKRRYTEGVLIGDNRFVLLAEGLQWPAIVDGLKHGLAVDTLVRQHSGQDIFGVPTFLVDQQAVFVRLLSRPRGDAELASTTVERVLDLAGGWSDLNELKHTSVPR